MSPRTNSPTPPYPYDDISDFDFPSGPSGHHLNNINQANLYPTQQQNNNIATSGSNILRSDITGTSSTRNNSSNNNDNEGGLFTSIFLRPLNVPRRVLSSSVVKGVSLMVLYSFCVTSVCFIFFASYLLTLYDDTRRLFRNSRAWARLRSGVRERIAMMGDDWEDFLQKYFDQSWDGVDVNRNAHLGGNNNNSNDSRQMPNPKDLEWLKGAMLGLIAVIAGQDITNKFQESFRGQPPTATPNNNDTGKK